MRSLALLTTQVVPFFKTYPLCSAKAFDFDKFASICGIMQQKLHLTPSGIIQIIDLAFQMNPSGKRKFSKTDLLAHLDQTHCGSSATFELSSQSRVGSLLPLNRSLDP